MSVQIIQEKIKSYSPQSKQEETNAIKEVYQEIALAALSRSGFFKIAAFQGGTCLRILYQLNRFSEDLDFILTDSKHPFLWEPFLHGMEQEFALYGIQLQAIDRSKAQQIIQKAFLKQNSFGKVLKLDYQRNTSDIQHITIRLEIDTNPPPDSQFSSHYLDFPLPFPIVTQDLPSLFAGKCHALLCREFLKGRDWYDFLWYMARRVPINFAHLRAALVQTNDWEQGSQTQLTTKHLIQLLTQRIRTINWTEAAKDVAIF